MKVVKGIGFRLPSSDDSYIRLDSHASLADADIAIFSPNLNTTNYRTTELNDFRDTGEYEGKKRYNKSSSASIKEHSEHWKKEFIRLLEAGGTLFVILKRIDDFFIYTGEKSYSGTGKSQKTTEFVKEFSNYDFLPFSKISYHLASGKIIVPNSSLGTDFYKNFKDLLTYETYLVGDTLNGIFTTKNKDRILGASLPAKNGHVIFLPDIDFDVRNFQKVNRKSGDGWTADAVKRSKVFLNCLVEIDKVISNKVEKAPRPDWAQHPDFDLEESKATKNKIEKLSKELEKKKEEIEKLSLLMADQDSLKDLLFETGKTLELSVIKALNILGYTAENYDDGTLELDQIISSPEGQRFIGECEGKDSRDIDITKFRQLLDGLNADFEKESVKEKAFGLLLGNPQRLIDPRQRTLDFTEKCRIGAKREKIGLIKTADLFDVCKIILESKDLDYAKQCREAILNQMGEVVKFPKPIG